MATIDPQASQAFQELNKRMTEAATTLAKGLGDAFPSDAHYIQRICDLSQRVRELNAELDHLKNDNRRKLEASDD